MKWFCKLNLILKKYDNIEIIAYYNCIIIRKWISRDNLLYSVIIGIERNKMIIKLGSLNILGEYCNVKRYSK